jgi:hypothetical protein
MDDYLEAEVIQFRMISPANLPSTLAKDLLPRLLPFRVSFLRNVMIDTIRAEQRDFVRQLNVANQLIAP